MLDKLGKKRFVVPVLAVILIGCVFSLMIYPMAHMEPKGLPFGVLTLDEGALTPAGEVNAGEVMAETLTASAEEGESGVEWAAFDDQTALDAAFERGELYGALVIPADFTAGQAAFAAGLASEAPVVTVYFDMAKSPMVANLMGSSISATLGDAGVGVETVTLNGGSASSSNPFLAVMSLNFIIMPLALVSLAAAMIISVLLAARPGSSRAARLTSLVPQLGCVLVASLCAAAVIVCIANFVLGYEDALGAMFGFAWIASFSVMLLVVGLASIRLPLGALALLCVMAGTCCGLLPYEMLPEFWQDWIYPWAPQHYIGDGLRAIIYLGEGALNESCVPLALTACVGLVGAAVSLLAPEAKQKEEQGE